MEDNGKKDLREGIATRVNLADSDVTYDGSPKDIKAGKHDELLSGMTNDDRMETMDALGASAKDQPKVNSNFRPLVVDPVSHGVNIFIPRKVVKKVMSPYIVATSNVVTPTVKKNNDGFQMVGKKKKRNGKFKPTNGAQFAGPLVKPNVRYEPKANTSAPKKRTTNVGNAFKLPTMSKTTDYSSKNDNIIMSNSYYVMNEKQDEEGDIENVYDETANLFPNTKTGRCSSFTAAAG
nr:hypothetical protein [Tanacetum cinerariifolium]